MSGVSLNILHAVNLSGKSSGKFESVQLIDIRKLSIDERRVLKVSKKSFYNDGVWDFTAELPDYAAYDVTLDFSKIVFSDGSNITDVVNKVYLDQVREFYYTLIVDPPSSYPKLTTWVGATKRAIKMLFDYMKINSIFLLADLDENDLADFLDGVAEKQKPQGGMITNRTLSTRTQGLDWLYEQGKKMSTGLAVNPFADYGTRSQWAKSASQKVLPRNRSRTIEIPDAVAELIVKHALEDLKISQVLLEVYEVERRFPMPGYGSKTRSAAIKKVYEYHGWWDNRIKGRIRKRLEARLEGAAYCLIALFTGMRLHEVLRIKYGSQNNWLEENIEIDGGIKKMYFVLSTTTKLEARPTSYKWQTIPIVKEALSALEQGFKRYFNSGNTWLFPARGKNNVTRKQATQKAAIGHNVKKLCKVHNIRHNEKIWDLASHQFRKKFARIMVRQGLGMKALQDQLKHYDIEMTKLYGDANLYVELQAEKFELSQELIEEFVGNQIPVIGGGAQELGTLRKEFLGLTKQDRIQFLTSLPTKALVEQTDDGLCFYRPNKALCGGDKANCRPADCNNAWMPAAGKKRTLLWRRQENERMMRFFTGQPLKLEFLKTRNVEIKKLLSQLDDLERIP